MKINKEEGIRRKQINNFNKIENIVTCLSIFYIIHVETKIRLGYLSIFCNNRFQVLQYALPRVITLFYIVFNLS